MSNDPKDPRPLVTDLPVLQIVEIEDARVDRLEELGNLLNSIGLLDPKASKSDSRCWN